MRFGVRGGGLMDVRYKVPEVYGLCLLAPASKRWETKLQTTEKYYLPRKSLADTNYHIASYIPRYLAANGSVENTNNNNPPAALSQHRQHTPNKPPKALPPPPRKCDYICVR